MLDIALESYKNKAVNLISQQKGKSRSSHRSIGHKETKCIRSKTIIEDDVTNQIRNIDKFNLNENTVNKYKKLFNENLGDFEEYFRRFKKNGENTSRSKMSFWT
jgi:hypothetical protein